MQLTIYESWKRGIKMIEKKYVEKSYGTAEISYQGAIISGVFNREQAALILTDAMQMKAFFDTMDVALSNAMKQIPKKGKKK